MFRKRMSKEKVDLRSPPGKRLSAAPLEDNSLLQKLRQTAIHNHALQCSLEDVMGSGEGRAKKKYKAGKRTLLELDLGNAREEPQDVSQKPVAVAPSGCVLNIGSGESDSRAVSMLEERLQAYSRTDLVRTILRLYKSTAAPK